ncbi:hypothetical protein VIBC2010_02653 [Vibrio caribbeanicus ATCC BAA-2122]|uniref:Uncharacterized protein n=1 Tax=Vibrio caribbeanicus ATCC BAA-2122 TaxID=796620 RepID=E3BFV9_9VIBR|nr:hypothetical protein VIBC2010_02653 [Vibrio caribbeanicus ATCC BAA-2122]
MARIKGMFFYKNSSFEQLTNNLLFMSSFASAYP